MTVNTRVVQLFLRQEDSVYVPLENGLRLQILPDVSFLPQCQKHHFAAFIQDSAVLVVWDDQPTHILSRVKDIEDQLMSMIWNDSTEDGERLSPDHSGKSTRQTIFHSPEAMNEVCEHNEKTMSEQPRKTVLIQSMLAAITLMLIVAAIGTGVRRMIVEVKVDHNYLRLALLVAAPLQIWLALVCQYRPHFPKLATNISSVLHAVSSNWRCTNNRTYQPNECKHQVLLWCGAASAIRLSSATCHNPVPRV
jgi:hypothetical protein